MPGRARIYIDANKLPRHLRDSLVVELEKQGHVIAGNSRLQVSFLSPYLPKPASDIGLIIRRLDRYVATTNNKTAKKGDLCKILGISLPTLNDWICRYWQEEDSDYIADRKKWYYHKIDLNEVKIQLSKMTLLCHKKPQKDAKQKPEIRKNWSKFVS